MHRTAGRTRLRCPEWGEEEQAEVVSRIGEHPRVSSVRYSPTSRSLTVLHESGFSLEEILASLADRVQRRREESVAEPPGPPFWRQLLAPGVALAAGLLGLAPLSTVAIAGCAVPIARRAVRSAAGRHLTIDVLDITAVSLLLGTGDLLAAGVSVALIETGEHIRGRASGRARRVLRGWMGADARGVRVLRDGSEPRLPIEEVAIGDLAVVYAGETIPVDGVVISGSGSIDNRTWTGEPLPVPVRKGATVLAGGSVNDGRLVLEVRATGDETRAGRLAAALEDAIAANTRVSDMARRLADRFVAPVFVLGGAVYLATGDLSRLISMLIVDFGTGLRIAVPTSVLTTMVAGARSNILFRNGRSIENLARVDTIVFDKTGTLTTGRPGVVRIDVASGFEENAVLRLAAAAEGHLPHPLARAVRRHARRRGLELPEPTRVRYEHGGGVEATIEGHHVLVGDRRMLDAHRVRSPSPLPGDYSVVLIAVDGILAARLQLRDRVREESLEAIAALRRLGVQHLRLATGDRIATAQAVARQLGLDGYDARMLPEDKVALVRRLRAEGRTVAVVGDGINDAAAMAEADVGVAVSRGAELARETADVLLGADDLMVLVRAVQLSREAMGLVRQNIALVAVPNGIALAVAGAGALPPLAATAANNGSTVIAALNALRPLRAKAAPRRLTAPAISTTNAPPAPGTRGPVRPQAT